MFDKCEFSIEHNLSQTSQLFRSLNNFSLIWIVEQIPIKHPSSIQSERLNFILLDFLFSSFATMGSSSSTSTSTSTSTSSSGSGSYKKQVYFDPEADKSKGSHYFINDADLLTKMREVANVDEKIVRVTIYRHDLWGWQVFELLVFKSLFC